MTVACVSRKTKPGQKRAFVLDEFAPYRIVALGHAISGRMAGAYRDEGITIPEWRVLAVIGQVETLAARDVVRKTPMDKMTVSRAVSSLEQKGFVHRATHPEDKRVSMLSLSQEGRALFDRVGEMALAFEDDLMSTLDPEEAAAFRSVLEKLSERVLHTEYDGE
ncbi:MAG: MarR family transcriptional regulator [Pseudomonadota bacterium]